MSIRDIMWILGIFVALGATWGMTSQRINAMERDIDRVEEALILFTKMEARIAVIENEIKNINKKLDK
tara:strand:- start:77 stop:280 length:204 start_codon:yes stop_codon:yes gene_type:complete